SSLVHAASLVDPARHAPALMQLIDVKLDSHVIDYVVKCVADTVEYVMAQTLSSSHATRGRRTRCPYTPRFTRFVANVLFRAAVTPPTLLTALVYIHRARPHLFIAVEEWALERVFLGALIVASKYTNDSTLKNVHWALCTGVFGKRDVGRIEREFLEVLDWELGIHEGDLLAHYEGVLAASTSSQPPALPSGIVLKSAPLRSGEATATSAITHSYHHHVGILSTPQLHLSSAGFPQPDTTCTPPEPSYSSIHRGESFGHMDPEAPTPLSCYA
ncbi:hypothetical protein B0H16DRAFT_1341022, partial [Mycena metata]